MNEFLPNPKGNGTHEWFELANDADTSVDLAGWAIDDAEGGATPYRLPQGSSIAPHNLLVITLPKALFNNSGDTVRLLHPDGTVADQYTYGQSAADRSFCRAENSWKLCEPSPNAPNQISTVADTPVAQPTLLTTQAPDRSSILHAQSVVSDSLPIAQLPAGSPNAIASASSYANATAGALYPGVASATLLSTSMPTPTLAMTQHTVVAPTTRSTSVSMGMGTGIFLFVAGGVMSGYDWLRSRRVPAPVEDSQVDLLEDELLADDQEI